MSQWSDDAARKIGDIAGRHGFGREAGLAMAEALAAGAGGMAQFGHPELGGMGQWSRGGMLMIGDMFNDNLKGRVRGLADDLSAAMNDGAIAPERRSSHGGGGYGSFGHWWPDELGQPSSTGAQNGQRYAVFPEARRLAIDDGERVRIYDTGDRQIDGAAQQQGGRSSLSFSGPFGTIGIEDLKEVDAARPQKSRGQEQQQEQRYERQQNDDVAQPARAETDAPSFAPPRAPVPSDRPTTTSNGDPLDLIRKLGDLRAAGLLTEDEFSAKKTELLARL